MWLNEHQISFDSGDQWDKISDDIESRFEKALNYQNFFRKVSYSHGESLFRLDVNWVDGRSWDRRIKSIFTETEQSRSYRKRNFFNVTVQNKTSVAVIMRLEMNHEILWLIGRDSG